MKTAISLPDATFARVDDAAIRMGLSRSEIFVRAAERYLDELDADSITDQINAALDAGGGTDETNIDAVEHARATLSASHEQW
ncbi:MAG: ribbon-helix-helix domain-containing protein [Actinomycetota bacterium]|nr:ribbon-helix-helix domain-containing protein [Actinomycetota bacterium]